MVRLKVPMALSVDELLANFNSTMVRLKDPEVRLSGRSRTFQFHYGTIKSYTASPWARPPHRISIPLWYD